MRDNEQQQLMSSLEQEQQHLMSLGESKDRALLFEQQRGAFKSILQAGHDEGMHEALRHEVCVIVCSSMSHIMSHDLCLCLDVYVSLATRGKLSASCINPSIMHQPLNHASTPQSCINPSIKHQPLNHASTPQSCINPSIKHQPLNHVSTPQSCINPSIHQTLNPSKLNV
jgi:hypothetical protein